MKKLLMQIIALVMCFTMAMPLFACNNNNGGVETSSSQSESVSSTTSSTSASTNTSASASTSDITSSTTSSTTSTPISSSSSSSIVASSSSSSQVSSSASSSSEYVPIQPSPVEVNSVILGDVRIQLLSKSLVRIENKGPKGFEDRDSYLVTNREFWEVVPYEKIEGAEETVVKTATYSIHLPNNGTAEDAYITTVGNDKNLYKYTGLTDTNVYLPSPSEELKSWYFTDSPRIIPSETGWNNIKELNQGWDFDNNATDIYVFLPNGDYETFTSDYVKLTGETEMVDLQTLGYWDSRWHAYSADTALQQIQDYRDRGYSIDVLVIDTDWRDATNGVGYEVNTDLFPNMAEFLAECERLGVDICFNDHPEPVGGTTSGLDGAEIDYRSNNLTLILSMGLDYWWYDRNWHVSLNSIHPDISVYAFGMYAYQFVTQEYLESITDLGEYAERGLIMANVDGCLHGKWNYASDLTAHRYSIQWTGDIGSDSNALAQEIYATVFGGAEVGLPYISSDIGGHNGKVTNEMYSRWMQYGALSTICRVHCTHKDFIGQDGRMPWLFGETAEEVAHTYLDMRYRLLPLYYYLSYRNYSTGLPIMERLDISYSDYIESQNNDQYLLGEYVLVAPLDSAGPSTKIPNSYLSHDGTNGKVAGLKAEYYNSNNWTGSATTTVDNNIFFNWGTSAPNGLGNDNFSVKWSGYFTVGDTPASLSFYADDAVIVTIDGTQVIDGSNVYDTMLTTAVFSANTTHSIEVKYAEFSGNAHIYMYYTEQKGTSASYNSRDVFIPDGTWIDVWSGTRFVGPCTYTVTHPLETSPIFVREGSLILLADNAINTREQIWDNLTLDVYPSKNFNAKATLYEDDTNTVAYKSGYFRTTDVEMAYDEDKNALVITINPTEGAFKGTKSFTERSWNIRLHSNSDWGAITSIKVAGQDKTFNPIAKTTYDLGGRPFAFSGGALDSDIVEFSIDKTNIYSKIVIEVYYESATISNTNTSYDKTAINFTMVAQDAGDVIDLDTYGKTTWVSYGDTTANDIAVKPNSINPFSFPTTYDIAWANYSNKFTTQYTLNEKTIASMGGLSSHKNIHFTIDTIGEEAYYIIYLGGKQSTAKVTVSDRAGNRVTEYIGDLKGYYSNRIVIHVTDTTVSKLYVTYAMHASETETLSGTSTSATGTGSPSEVTLFACIVSNEIPPIHNYQEGNLTVNTSGTTNATGSACLTTYGETFGESTLDWIHTGNDGGISRVRKYGGNNITNLGFEQNNPFYDYAMSLSYFDGEELGAHTGSTKGLCSPGSISATVLVTPNVKHIVLFTGAWRSSNQVYVYDRLGNFLTASEIFTAGESSVCKVVTISVNAIETDLLTIKIISSNAGDGGNVSLPAIVVTGTAEEKTTSSSLISSKSISGEVNLTEYGQTDWFYLANASQKVDGTAFADVSNIAMGGVYDLTNYGASISYTDGTDGTKTGLTNGKNLDFARFKVTLEEGYNYLDLFVAIKNCKAGVHLLDSNYTIIGSYTPSEDTTDTLNSLHIRILLNCEKAETITVIYYKGGSGSGAASLVAATLTSNASPSTGLNSTVSVNDIAGQNIFLNNCDNSLDTLYWEHYSTSGLESMLNAQDLVTSNSIQAVDNFGFNDYKATLNWTNGTNNTSWITNTNGLCAGNTEYEVVVNVNKNVKAIKIYTGAWQATGTATLYHNDILKATSESWTADSNGIARCVTFTISTNTEEVVKIKLTPSNVEGGGNLSMVAVAVLGTNTSAQTTSLSLSTTEMLGYNDYKYNLTEYGTQDWYYTNYEHVPDEKAGGTFIDTTSVKAEGNGKMWDYKAAFSWTDGTVNATSEIDNDCDNAGTNNGICGAYVKISTVVDTSTKNIYLWVAGWESEYYVQVIDSRGNILTNQLMHGAESGKTYAYLCDFAINATTSEKLTFIVYRTSNGGNCTISALAQKGEVVVENQVTASAQVGNIEGNNIYLNNIDAEKETLYWEHYTSGSTEKMLNATDIIQNSAESIVRGFSDYKATLNWTNGTNNLAWITNTSGLCEGQEFTITATINPNVSAILIYTGAWRATGTATLSYNNEIIATSESWTAGDTGIARLVKFDITTNCTDQIIIKITPSNMGDGGNVSMVAVAVLGENNSDKKVTTSLSTTEMTGHDTCSYNLSEYGTQDWYYTNYNNGNPEEKANGTAIDTTSLKVESNSNFWDYKASFSWNDGTVNPNGYQDDDIPSGSNNGKCGAYAQINVTVTKDTKNVYLWVGGWTSTYYVQVIDSNGNVLVNQLMHEATDTTYAYLCDFAINATSTETLTFTVYRTSSSGNASLAAIAVKN